jgi:hypothetical protein
MIDHYTVTAIYLKGHALTEYFTSRSEAARVAWSTYMRSYDHLNAVILEDSAGKVIVKYCKASYDKPRKGK